jgi:hypothetical protein
VVHPDPGRRTSSSGDEGLEHCQEDVRICNRAASVAERNWVSFSAESSAVRPWPLVLVLDERIGDNALIDAAQRAQSACAEERTESAIARRDATCDLNHCRIRCRKPMLKLTPGLNCGCGQKRRARIAGGRGSLDCDAGARVSDARHAALLLSRNDAGMRLVAEHERPCLLSRSASRTGGAFRYRQYSRSRDPMRAASGSRGNSGSAVFGLRKPRCHRRASSGIFTEP